MKLVKILSIINSIISLASQILSIGVDEAIKEMDTLGSKIDKLHSDFDKKIDKLQKALDKNIDKAKAKIEDISDALHHARLLLDNVNSLLPKR